MTLATAIQKPVLKPRYVAICTGYLLLRGWLVYSTDAYELTPANVANEDRLTAVYFNETLLSPQASIADVEAADGRWFQDSAGVVYVNPPTGESIYTGTVRGQVIYYFGKDANILGTRYHEPRLLSIPQLSLRIEPRFSGVGQIGSGSASFANLDGWFDDRAEIRWSTVQFKVGADTPSSTMASADYQPFGFWKVQDTGRDGDSFSMQLIEPKAVLRNLIPSEVYTREDYPNIGESDLGKAIPRAYGKIFAATPVCIDSGAKTFKVAGHAIYDFTGVRILQDNVWNSIPFASTDEANGEFTLGAEWANNEQVCVDFIGRVRSADGLPMYNASEIVQDILEYLGESDFDTDAFDAARAALNVGYFANGIENAICKPAFFLDAAVSALDVTSKINSVAGSFLYVDANGQWHYEVFRPKLLADADATFDESEIAERTVSEARETRDTFSKVIIRYAERLAEKWSEFVQVEDAGLQYMAQSGSPIPREIMAPLFDDADAEYFGQRLLTTEAQPLKKYPITVPWKGILLKPGHQIAVTYPRLNVNGMLEVLEARHNLDRNEIALVCGDRRGWADSFGWWVADGTADYDSGGTATEKREAKEATGFWHEDDQLADSTDSSSHKLSRFF